MSHIIGAGLQNQVLKPKPTASLSTTYIPYNTTQLIIVVLVYMYVCTYSVTYGSICTYIYNINMDMVTLWHLYVCEESPSQ